MLTGDLIVCGIHSSDFKLVCRPTGPKQILGVLVFFKLHCLPNTAAFSFSNFSAISSAISSIPFSVFIAFFWSS